jgi:hypothetical protein
MLPGPGFDAAVLGSPAAGAEPWCWVWVQAQRVSAATVRVVLAGDSIQAPPDLLTGQVSPLAAQRICLLARPPLHAAPLFPGCPSCFVASLAPLVLARSHLRGVSSWPAAAPVRQGAGAAGGPHQGAGPLAHPGTALPPSSSTSAAGCIAASVPRLLQLDCVLTDADCVLFSGLLGVGLMRGWCCVCGLQLAAGLPVDVMPGASDPANYSLPQQVSRGWGIPRGPVSKRCVSWLPCPADALSGRALFRAASRSEAGCGCSCLRPRWALTAALCCCSPSTHASSPGPPSTTRW